MIALIKGPVLATRRLLLIVDPWSQAIMLATIRLYLAWVFIRAGMVKIQSWDSTLLLFEYEYTVPVIAPVLAAWMATAGELILPALLAAGLATRFSAGGLFILNAVALISYPDISPAGVKDHYLWGWLAAMLVIFGSGKISLDQWLLRWVGTGR